jgi:hypothetical protein
MSNLFQKAFVSVLREQPELEPSTYDISDSEAMVQTLDKGTDPSMLDVEGGPEAGHLAATSKMQQNMVITLSGWIDKLDEFSNFLNNPSDPNSIQYKLKNSVRDTLFDKIRVAETKKISRVAVEIASLNELMRGYSASVDDSKFRGV